VVRADGTAVSAERSVADAHPNGRRPWRWPDYVAKLDRLTAGQLPRDERDRFVDLAAGLGRLTAAQVRRLNPVLPPGAIPPDPPERAGIF
jgi:2-methylcitrate dehydratase